MTGRRSARIERQVARAAALLHIERYLDRYPAQLSGGQRQRVAVARALAIEPAVLLMDEPLSNLDALLRLEMRAELKSVLREAGTTTVYVTHDQTEAMGLADRMAVLHAGRIQQIGAPADVYRHPATTFVGGFVGSPPMNFLSVACAQTGAAQLRACRSPRRQFAKDGKADAGHSRGGSGHRGHRISVHRARGRADGFASTPHGSLQAQMMRVVVPADTARGRRRGAAPASARRTHLLDGPRDRHDPGGE